MIDELHERVRRIKERQTILKWEYRQRQYSKGVWFRVRRALTGAEELWRIGTRDADRLQAEGFEPLPVGAELFPSKRMFVVPREKLAELRTAEKIAIHLDAEFLSAKNLALVPFEVGSGSPKPLTEP